MRPDLAPTMMAGDVELILIPAGQFTMGSDGGRGNEKPSHKVHLDAFYIGKYPITNDQYRRFLDATGHRSSYHQHGRPISRIGSPRKGKKAVQREPQLGHVKTKKDHPAVLIGWHDAQDYCHWLSEESGLVIRPPTEAEWEKAARGTNGVRYPWGDEFDEWNCNTEESDIRDTTPVGEYSPEGDSPYGVADMAGNVWEWTGSLFKPYPYQPNDGREGLEGNGARIIRGGSFNCSRHFARVSSRLVLGPIYVPFLVSLGFRVVALPQGSP